MTRKALALAALAMLVALVGGTGRAQAAGGTYRITAGGDGIVGWAPDSGAIDQTSDDQLSATGTLASGPPQGAVGTADYAIAAGPGIVRASIDGSFTVPSNLSYPFAPTMQAVSTTELTISAPDDRFVNTSVNLHVDGIIEAPVCGGPGQCGAESVHISVGPFVRQGEFNTFGETRDNSLGLALDPVPGGYRVHGEVTSSTLGIRTNTPTPVTIVLNLSGRYGGSPAPTTLGGDFGDPSNRYQVSFAPSGPVLNDIPAGYTVSGPSVVENHWTDPFAPPSGDAVITSCAQLAQPTVVHGNLVIRNLAGCPAISLPNLTRVDGDIVIEGADAPIEIGPDTSVGGAIDVSGTGGDLTIDQTSVGEAIDVSGTGGDLTIDQTSVGEAIDVSGTGGDLTITDNGVEAVSADDSGADVTITGNLDSATITVGETGGDLTITDNGTAVVNAGNGQVGGNATIETGGDSFSGTTADGSTSVTILGGTATMHVGLPKEAFAQPVGFTITRRTDSSGTGTTSDGTSAVIDPVAGFEFAFDVPTLNADAQLSFVVDMSRLDAQGRADLLNALGSGVATIVGKGNDPGATYRAFAVCSGSQTPAADGCVAISLLAADGTPTTGEPAFVRFDGVVGHFSTYAVATVTAEQGDTAPPVVTVPADLVVDATSPAGSRVTYAASAKDDTDPSPTLACSPASGHTFAIGTTDVTCTATDASGYHAAASFTVRVRGAGEQIARLIDKTRADVDLPLLRPVLAAPLQAASALIAAGRTNLACVALGGYIVAVRLAPSRALTQAEKTDLVADARRIRAVAGC
jgi:hypothetical protein